MDKTKKTDEINKIIKLYTEKLSQKCYNELNKIKPYSEEYRIDDNIYCIEIQLIESTDKYVHVSIAVDDGSFKLTTFPKTGSFLVYKDGRVDK